MTYAGLVLRLLPPFAFYLVFGWLPLFEPLAWAAVIIAVVWALTVVAHWFDVRAGYVSYRPSRTRASR